MNRFKAGDFNQQLDVNGNDEIAELTKVFNSLVKDLSNLIDINYIMALRERESELSALQAQINPHFLYNTLDSLYWQAVDQNQEELAEDILSMAELFRLLLSSGESEIPVRQELKIIAHYLQIQKMRFAKKFDYNIDVEEALMERMIPKLIIQPFVENAVVHGLEEKDSQGKVEINGRIAHDMMVFTIEDTGAGMSQETIDEIMKTEQRYADQRIARYAIRNVRERMRLRYGQQSELSIESELGVGSRVCISIPLEMPDSNGSEISDDNRK
jgi:two-component system sensor histidine kinase YesM